MRNKIKLYSFLFVLIIEICTAWGQDKELSAGQRQYIPIEYNGETIYKWLSIIKVKEYDGEGKLIYEGNGSTDNTWYEYDGQGNKICCKIESQRRGEVYYAEERYEYNTKGHLIRMDKKGSGEQHEVTYQYYKDKGILYCTDSDGLIYAYDSKGYLLSKKRKNSNYGGTIVATFNDDGTVTMGGKSTNEFSEEYLYKYDTMGNIIYEECKTSGQIQNIQLHKYDYINNRIYSYRKWSTGNYFLESIHLLEYYKDGKTLKKDTQLFVDRDYQGLWYPLY
ncbi:hypothetical protein GWP43_02960 [Treponema vincentii]|uniref:YD repeat protein n=1 Tax=Treponema vincentii TaxID=69710 RepID=A0A6P1XZQ9_9SPIR|nr:hypothetical protein [Treponema vincentii]QHX42579.1 hypothetical protein GWP43_02960 [Treponema vincentii]